MLAKVVEGSKKDLGNCWQYMLSFTHRGQEKRETYVSHHGDLDTRDKIEVYYLGSRLTLLKSEETNTVSDFKDFEWIVDRNQIQFNPPKGKGKQEFVIPMQDNMIVKVVDWGERDNKGVFKYVCDVYNQPPAQYIRLKFYYNTTKGAIKAKRNGDRETRDVLTAGVSVDEYKNTPYIPQAATAEEYAAQMQGGGLYAILGLAGGQQAAPAPGYVQNAIAAPAVTPGVPAPAQTVVNVPPRGDRQPSPNLPVPGGVAVTPATAPVPQAQPVTPAPVAAAPVTPVAATQPAAMPNPYQVAGSANTNDLAATIDARAEIVTDYIAAVMTKLSAKSGIPVAQLYQLDAFVANVHGAGSYVANDNL